MKFLDDRKTASPTRRLRELIAGDRIVIGAGAHDALSARLVEEAGFPLCVVTGAGISMCRGYPDVGFISLEETIANARYIAEAVKIPVIFDADTGYGNALNAMRTIREFERAGVAGVQMEDQEWPRRRGQKGKPLVSAGEMVQKIKAALDARRDEDFVVIARCVGLPAEGLEQSLERGEAYREAGADMLFYEMRDSLDEIKAIAAQFRGRIPLHFNYSPSGIMPKLDFGEVEALGYKTACFYAHTLMAACYAMQHALEEIKKTRDPTSISERLMSFKEMQELVRLDEVRAAEKKYGA